jgi:hypothetical protein
MPRGAVVALGRWLRRAKIRARGERAVAALKTRRILAELRCYPRRAAAIVQAKPTGYADES